MLTDDASPWQCYSLFPDYFWFPNEWRTAPVWRGHRLNLLRQEVSAPFLKENRIARVLFRLRMDRLCRLLERYCSGEGLRAE
jgi:hypothetical protein